MKKTVRIAVAIDSTGAWNSCGFGKMDEEINGIDMMSFAIEPLENVANQYFIEAEIDMPEIKTIEPISVSLVKNTD